MNEENNEAMKRLIIDWGLPEYINQNKDDIIFKFDDNGIVDTEKREYHCRNGSVKFCLFDERNKKVLFSMDFYKSGSAIAKLRYGSHGVVLNIQLLYVHDESLRKKGISSYYIEKLKEYAIQEKAECIYVHANADARNFNGDSKINSLRQSELEEFYKKRCTNGMPIKLKN